MTSIFGRLIEAMIAALVLVLGRTVRRADAPWLVGPVGSDLVGSDFHSRLADAQRLELRSGPDQGLLRSCDELAGEGFDPRQLDPRVRSFYEHTSGYRLDVWSQWSPLFWPFGFALVRFVSRRMQQLNFPLYPIETSRGITNRVVQLVRADGELVYTSWVRESVGTKEVIYAGLYSTCHPPGCRGACVRVLFPVPRGCVCTILLPANREGGGLELRSEGRHFGDPAFYRMRALDDDRLRVWQVRPMREVFHVYPDSEGVIRTDHLVSLFGLPVLRLHYRIVESAQAEAPAPTPTATAG